MTKAESGIKTEAFFIRSKAVLAPLAGVTDYPLRSLIREYSPYPLLTAEMISSEALVMNSSTLITHTDEKEAPVSWQISGHKPEIAAKAAKILEPKASLIDINMGCPVKKIVNGSDGCALMKTPELAQDIVRAVKEAVSVPVSCKFRLGWSHESANFIEFAQKMQEAGASLVTIHARYRSQMYSGSADWKALSDLRGCLDIPYIANGDITSPEKAQECLEITKADGIAIGRAAMGDLSLIARVHKYLDEGILLPEPDLKEKISMLKKHLDAEIAFRGHDSGIKFFRKFYPHYIKNIKGSSEYRRILMTELDYGRISSILDGIIKNG